MLKQLSISNYILIEDIKIYFQEGLTIITGETGAGKSILLGSLRLIMGERADVKTLRIADKKCVIEAIFDLSNLDLISFFEENELDYDNETIIRREIAPTGKSRIFINDTPVTLAIANNLSEKLIDIHSQFSNNQLRNPLFHLQIIDALVTKKSLFETYRKKYKEYKKIDKELSLLNQNFLENIQTREYNLYLLEELTKANFKEGEQEELENKQKQLSNATEILSSLERSIFILENEQTGTINALQEILQILNKIANKDIQLQQYKERIDSVAIELKDLLVDMNSFSSDFEVNPAKLEEINQKIGSIFMLQTKHKVTTIKELLFIKEQLEQSTLSLEDTEIGIQKLKTKKDSLFVEITKIANEISLERNKVVPLVEKELEKTISRMGIESAYFSVSIEKQELMLSGQDNIKLFFSANKGSKLESIEKVASGGEIARVSLAIKKLIAAHFQLPTLVLDEIDTGISGKVAHQMGEIMQEMAKDMQVFVITHNPQIAAKGQTHLKVYKEQEKETTKSYIKELKEEEKIREIAQLISGENISDSALAQAKELFKN